MTTTAHATTPRSADPLIETHDLRCAYGKFEAVRGIGITIGRGELYALLGTNGAGKTTTLETLEGHRRPTSGSLRVLGGDPRSVAVRRRIGMMLQESGFAGDLTVYETLELWSRIAGRLDNAETLLDRLDLARRRNVRVAQLSGGERRRLDLAMALYGSPELLFLDEPTTGLDPESRSLVWDLIRGLQDHGVTIMLTTHYLEEAEALADRVAIMHDGRIAVEGTVAHLLSENSARIEFDLPEGIAAQDLPFTVDTTSNRGARITVVTDHLEADLEVLLQWARVRNLRLGHLEASDATLNELFQSIARGTPTEVAP
ncbi:MAG: ABC transporter ATP-binding protein [Aquihabitans sp.]